MGVLPDVIMPGEELCPICGGAPETCPIEQRTWYLENLGCANCAAKMERRIGDLPRVQEASVAFATKQLRVVAPHIDEMLSVVQNVCQSIEADVRVLPKAPSRTHAAASCCDSGCQGTHNHKYAGEHAGGYNHEHANGQDHTSYFSTWLSTGFLGRLDASAWRDLATIAIAALFLAVGLMAEHTGAPYFAVVAIFVLAYVSAGFSILAASVRNIRLGDVFDENLLMSVASLGAFALGEFPEAVGVMMFYRIGKFFEDRAVEHSRDQIKDAVDMRPATVNLVPSYVADRGANQQSQQVPAAQVVVGDYLLVRPGERVPIDGEVVQGTSRLDTSAITGEPVPRAVHPKSQVVSGCVNMNGVLVIRAHAPLSESMVTRILDSVEHAAARKPQMERFIAKFAHVYTPIVIAIAAATAIVPSLVTGNWSQWLYTACTFLVISCPCAIVLSVPLSFFAGIGAAAKEGILFKGGTSLEAFNAVHAIALDKTGTITQGVFAVRNVHPFAHFAADKVLAMAACAEMHSTHPLATSIVEHARAQGITLVAPSHVFEHVGQGVQAWIGSGDNAIEVLCGNNALMRRFGVSVPSEIDGKRDKVDVSSSIVLVAIDRVLAGRVHIADVPKPDAARAVARMNEQGLHTVMLTGDAPTAANEIARQVGISDVRAGLLPQNKFAELQSVRAQFGPVLFVGDGINDAPVLAGADIGAAFAKGADAAMEAADVVLMRPDLTGVLKARSIAKTVRLVATCNIVFALAVKLAVMMLGFIGMASMWAAVFADVGVALLCTLNSVRVLGMRF